MTATPLLYLQSGGPTAVLNASARGVIEAARQSGCPLLAARNGLCGLLRGELFDTRQTDDAEVARLSSLPGASFGVSRYMMPPFDQDSAPWLALRAVLARHGIHHLLLNGGNGSMGSAARLAEFERHTGYPLNVIGIPKTIDNDLLGTDFSPGFPSAAKYLAATMREVGLDMVSMEPRRLFIMETMGRHSGWLAAATAAAAQQAGDAPHLILLPEVPFDVEQGLSMVEHSLRSHGHCAITVAEGLKGLDGRPVAEARHDAVYGHEQLGGAGTWLAGVLKRRLGLTAHVAQVDCLQRAARHLVAPVDLEMARQAGAMAVQWAQEGRHGVMVGLARLPASGQWGCRASALADVGDLERALPADYIDAGRLQVTPAFLAYMRPLLAGEAWPAMAPDGLPDCRPVGWQRL